jgi:hypothetical protein
MFYTYVILIVYKSITYNIINLFEDISIYKDFILLIKISSKFQILIIIDILLLKNLLFYVTSLLNISTLKA